MIREWTDKVMECTIHNTAMRERQLTLTEEREVRDCDLIIDDTRKHWVCDACRIVWVSIIEDNGMNVLVIPKSH